MKTQTVFSRHQRGAMLLEALIAILIFSIGILAIVGLQVNSIKLANDARYRSDASFLANQYIGAMQVAQSSPTFVNDYQTGGARYLAWWNSSVQAALPTTGASAPTVTITQSAVAVASAVSSTVAIQIFWSVPGESAGGGGAAVHRYQTQTQISN